MYMLTYTYKEHRTPNKQKGRKMTNITVKTRKELDEKTKEYRNRGYMIITFTEDYRELERGSEIVIIERQKRTRRAR